MQNADTLQKFIFENSNIRGDLIHLGASYQTARERYDYPDAVAEQLGEALVASVLLGATIKYEGSLILQIQSQGPINMLVSQCSHDRHIRGLARWQGEVSGGSSLQQTYGDGHVAITVTSNRSEERYQGITALQGDNLAQTIESYFSQSEQLQTRLWLFANNEQAVGMLLQHLPGTEPDEEVWNRIEALGSTITREEMLTLPTLEILHRLFHEEDVRLFDPEPISFRCSCSREKIINMLRTLGLQEAREILQEQGHIEVGCEFCNQHHTFDEVDVEEMFASQVPPPSPTTRQ